MSNSLKNFLVAIIFLIVVKLWVVDPYLGDSASLSDECSALQHTVERSRNLLAQRERLETYFQKEKKVHAVNETYLQAVEADKGAAVSTMQKNLAAMMKELEIKATSIRWGTPYSAEGSEYVRLPVSFSFSASPDQWHQFLASVASQKPMLVFDTLTVSKQRKELRVSAQLTGFMRQASESDLAAGKAK